MNSSARAICLGLSAGAAAALFGSLVCSYFGIKAAVAAWTGATFLAAAIGLSGGDALLQAVVQSKPVQWLWQKVCAVERACREAGRWMADHPVTVMVAALLAYALLFTQLGARLAQVALVAIPAATDYVSR